MTVLHHSHVLSRSSRKNRSWLRVWRFISWTVTSSNKGHSWALYCFFMSIVSGLFLTIGLHQQFWGTFNGKNTQTAHYNLHSFHTQFGSSTLINCKDTIRVFQITGTEGLSPMAPHLESGTDVVAAFSASKFSARYSPQFLYFTGCDALFTCDTLSFLAASITLVASLCYFLHRNCLWMLLVSGLALSLNFSLLSVYQYSFLSSQLVVFNATGYYSASIGEVFRKDSSYWIFFIGAMLQVTCPLSVIIAIWRKNHKSHQVAPIGKVYSPSSM